MDISQIQKSLFVNEDTLDDLEDEEEYPLPIQNSNIQMQMQNNNIIQASKEYIDAASIISTKPWDHASWLTYVEEVLHYIYVHVYFSTLTHVMYYTHPTYLYTLTCILHIFNHTHPYTATMHTYSIIYIQVEQGRGGAATVEEVYIRFLEGFPLAFKVWRKLANYYYNQKQDYKQAESVYIRCLDTCRNITLYIDYINMMKMSTLETINRISYEKQYVLVRNNIEMLIEKAVNQVGMFIDASPLWRIYIDFIKVCVRVYICMRVYDIYD